MGEGLEDYLMRRYDGAVLDSADILCCDGQARIWSYLLDGDIVSIPLHSDTQTFVDT